MPLTDAAIRNAKPGSKPRKLADEKGLFVLVHPNGSKYWRLKYRFAGKEKLLALGVYPEISLQKARSMRDTARAFLGEGVDPVDRMSKSAMAREAKVAAGNSFETVAREWLENIRAKWTAGHYNDTLKRFQTYVFPEIGGLALDVIKAPLLLAMARKIEATGAIETAHKITRACGQVFRYGISAGRCENNPAADLRGALKPKPEVRHMAAIPASELPSLLRKIDGYATEAGGDQQTQLALKLLALTFVRTSELVKATWDEFDLDAAVWRIPAQRMKMGAEHVVPLSRQALGIIRKLQVINGAYQFVFPGRTPAKSMSKNTILFALYRMGYRGRMTGHGFRAVASTVLNDMRLDPDVIERQLAHAERNKVRAAYHRTEYLEQRKAMMQHWADILDSLAEGGAVIPGSFGKAA